MRDAAVLDVEAVRAMVDAAIARVGAPDQQGVLAVDVAADVVELRILQLAGETGGVPADLVMACARAVLKQHQHVLGVIALQVGFELAGAAQSEVIL